LSPFAQLVDVEVDLETWSQVRRSPWLAKARSAAKPRGEAFTPEVFASPLAKRPYDLRHACLSTWLHAGVEPTRVALWAGNSLRVLLHTHAKCFDGGEQAALDRVEALLTPKPKGVSDAR